MRIRQLVFVLPVSLCLSDPALAQATATRATATQATATQATATRAAATQFSAEAEAKASCPADSVIWVNKQSKVIHTPGSQHYGKTKSGVFMCRQPAEAAGFHAPRARTTAAKPASPPSGATTAATAR